jgi:hypothetical protein
LINGETINLNSKITLKTTAKLKNSIHSIKFMLN